LNKNTISLSYTGTEGDLELLKNYISKQECQRKIGVKAMGLYRHDGKWVYVSSDGAVQAGCQAINDIVQLEKYRSISSEMLTREAVSADKLKTLGSLLLSYNEAAKTVAVLAWCAGCFIKEHLKQSKIKFPHLFLIGEAGSGKSNTLERIILPIFSRAKVSAATQVTAFTLMKDSSSSNLVPQALDEFKPSKMDKNKLAILYNHMRDSYDGHAGVRGRADQTSVTYELSAPLVVAGEESPDEHAIRERSIELLFSKKDLKSYDYRRNFNQLCSLSDEVGSLGRGLLNAALETEVNEAEVWYKYAADLFDSSFPSRVVNNLACCVSGIKLLEKLCKSLSLSWNDVFDIPIETCINHLSFAAKEYLLDGNTSNKGLVEQSLEIMARMGLDSQSEWTLLEKNSQVAIRFNAVYDRFTKYRRDHAIGGECLEYRQFLKQLKKSDLFLDYKPVRFGGDLYKAYVLDYELVLGRCDLESFDNSSVEPLV
jgi:hypothetical protein